MHLVTCKSAKEWYLMCMYISCLCPFKNHLIIFLTKPDNPNLHLPQVSRTLKIRKAIKWGLKWHKFFSQILFTSECPHYWLALFSSFITKCTQLTTRSVVSYCWSVVSAAQASQRPCLHQLHVLSTALSWWSFALFSIGLCLFPTPSLPLIY